MPLLPELLSVNNTYSDTSSSSNGIKCSSQFENYEWNLSENLNLVLMVRVELNGELLEKSLTFVRDKMFASREAFTAKMDGKIAKEKLRFLNRIHVFARIDHLALEVINSMSRGPNCILPEHAQQCAFEVFETEPNDPTKLLFELPLNKTLI